MSCGSPELLNGAAAVSAREEAGLGFYRRMGVTGGRFPSPGRQCGAGGVRNRGSSAWRAAVAGNGVVASTGRVGARVELGCCQGRPVSSKPGARGWFWAEARRVGGQVAGAGVRTPS